MATTIEQSGSRLYLVDLPFAAKDEAKRIGCHWDSDRRQWWIGTAKRDAATALVERLNTRPAADDPAGSENPNLGKGLPAASESDDRRVYAKVTYKGSNYYVIAESHAQGRCMVCRLTGSGFWIDMAACELVKTYAPREYRGRTEYTTLGSIRRFVERQKAGERDGLPQCAACGKRSNDLHHDLEDGLQKCYGCCDMPE